MQWQARRNGPSKLIGELEQVVLLRLILENPGIYLLELQNELLKIFGVSISVATICIKLKYMGCTRQSMHQIALQQSDVLRAKFMAEISIYDPSMLIWLDESGCDRRNMTRKYAYSLRGMPLKNQIVSIEGIHDVHITDSTIFLRITRRRATGTIEH